MIQIGLFYLLPFMLIFIFFGRLGQDYNRKMGLPIFLSLVIFFSFQLLCRFSIMISVLKFSISENPKQTIVDNILLINISSFIIAALSTYIYYRFTRKKIQISESEKANEIENLGGK